MTRLRRLLHRFGWHWWTPWRSAVATDYILHYHFLELSERSFQRRTCQAPGCKAEQRRIK